MSDFAGALSPDASQRLERQLAGYEQGTTRQIAVAIFRSLEGESLEDFTMRLVEKWKIGGKKSSDGVLLALFLNERRVRIEVGYGLEGQLPDARASQIIREVLGPRMRANDLEGALRETVLAIAQATGGAPGVAAAPRKQGPRAVRGPGTIFFLLILVFVVLPIIIRARRGGGLGGGGIWVGGGGGWSSGDGGGWSSSDSGWSGGGGSFGGGGSSGDW